MLVFLVLNKLALDHVNQRILTTLGQSEILERIQTRLRTGVEDIGRAKAWVNKNLGGALSVIVVGLNLKDTIDRITLDDALTASEIKTLTSTTAIPLVQLWHYG